MKSRRQNISRRNTRSMTFVNGRGNTLPISIELVMEIFSWLPAKSIARCRCVSKLWNAVLRRPDFTELYLTRSYSDRPQLLFAFRDEKENGFVFFSLQHPQNPVENSSFAVATSRFTHSLKLYDIVGISNGFVLLRGIKRNPPGVLSLLFNPSTGQSLLLPEVKPVVKPDCYMIGLTKFMGYDPVKKQFKVLSANMSGVCGDYERYDEFQVLTLGIGKPSWRMVECCLPHYPKSGGICINGVFYYLGAADRGFDQSIMVVCIDLTSEKFSFLNFSGPMQGATTLINYNGKLGSLMSKYFYGRDTSFELWVLDDLEKKEWSKHVFVLYPPVWQHAVEGATLRFFGVVGTNEFVFVPAFLYKPFYVFYYNVEKNTVVRVGVRGMKGFYGDSVDDFSNHVENVELIRAF
ncbi:PREDICTED: putative F-box protein At2g19630 [Camelina sativa]|uniref:F-box protein At2g19630 n=1 Tax=Camelina sativa TaxID=90675 RepID=A0ABM0V3S3_CAMSA|nr:PREDICTED: putative F-box protein At2g19630 [Camelina sativa]